MKSFEHVLTFPKDSLDSGLFPTLPAKGLHKLSMTFKSAIVVHHGQQTCNVLRLLSLIQMGLQHGDRITVTIEGEDEDKAAPAIEAFFKANL